MSSGETRGLDPAYWGAQMEAVSRRRDRASFMRIYDYYAPRVRMYLKGIGSAPDSADELAQEALLRVWLRATAYDPARSSLSTWLFRIARNLHIDRVRHEACWTDTEDDAEWSDGDAGSSTAESHAEHADLQSRIDRLPAIQARLIRMSYFEAKSHQEIANQLGMPLGSVKSSLRRAFMRLQTSVRGER